MTHDMTREALARVMAKKAALGRVTTPAGVEITINGNKHLVSEVEFVHNYMELPRVIVHGNIDYKPHTGIKDVIFNPPATIVFWSDNTKTVVKADGEPYDPEKGIAMAVSKKMLGDNKYDYYNIFKRYLKKWNKQNNHLDCLYDFANDEDDEG